MRSDNGIGHAVNREVGHALPASARLWAGVLATWLGFWLLMFAVGLQDYWRGGGRQVFYPAVDYGSAALITTLIAAWQLRRAPSLDRVLDRPLQWIARMLVWVPPIALGYVGALFGLRAILHAMAGTPYKHDPWRDALPYEVAKFAIFYVLFTGVHFGVRSYRALMLERLSVEQQARLVQAAQLAQLTQQLQPHFLFNALNTVSSLIHADPDLADALLTRLATLLRAATDASQRPEQSLDEELALLQAYADIMLQRFADRASIAWEIDDGARTCRVPTLGLQPLLENCFKHGVERRRAMTRIVVRARCEQGTLRIEIEDDGEAPNLPPRFGVGLGNLRRRIDALHGARASLVLQARPPPTCGVVVRLELPCAC